MAIQCCGEHLHTQAEVIEHDAKEHVVGDRRAVPLTVAGAGKTRRVAGRVLTEKGVPVEIMLDDPEVVQAVLSKIEEGSYHFNGKEAS